MRSAIVGGKDSRLFGAKCRLCRHATCEGEAVLYDRLPSYGFVDNRYVMHVECTAAAVARARSGRPVRAVRVQYDAIRRRAIAISQRHPQPVDKAVHETSRAGN